MLRDDVLSRALQAACRSALAEQPGAPPAACHMQLGPANTGHMPAWKALAEHLSSGCGLRVRNAPVAYGAGSLCLSGGRCLAKDVALL